MLGSRACSTFGARRYLYSNQLSGTLPRPLGSLILLIHMYVDLIAASCANRNVVREHGVVRGAVAPLAVVHSAASRWHTTFVQCVHCARLRACACACVCVRVPVWRACSCVCTEQSIDPPASTEQCCKHCVDPRCVSSEWFGSVLGVLCRDLDYNQLSGTLPSSLGSLQRLRVLYVGRRPTAIIHISAFETFTACCCL